MGALEDGGEQGHSTSFVRLVEIDGLSSATPTLEQQGAHRPSLPFLQSVPLPLLLYHLLMDNS